MKKSYIIPVAILVLATFAIVLAEGGSIWARHKHMAGGDVTRCVDCHNAADPQGGAEAPSALGGRAANMGGGDDCDRCHDGTHPKAPDFTGILPCAQCHPSK